MPELVGLVLVFLSGVWTGGVIVALAYGEKELRRLRAKVPANSDNFVGSGIALGSMRKYTVHAQVQRGDDTDVEPLVSVPPKLWAHGAAPSTWWLISGARLTRTGGEAPGDVPKGEPPTA